MKKLLSLTLMAAMFAFVACGPSAEEKAAAEKATQDSIAMVEKMYQDSMAAAQAAAAQAMQDSINAANMKAMQDSMAAISKQINKPGPRPKSIEEKKKEEAKKATQGRG